MVFAPVGGSKILMILQVVSYVISYMISQIKRRKVIMLSGVFCGKLLL